MPWKAIALDDKESKTQLSTLFEVEGIPTFVVVKRDGTVVTTNGRSKVSSDPDNFPWPPKPCTSLSEAVEDINDIPTAILFTDMVTDAAAEVSITTAFQSVAAEYFKDGKQSDAIRFAVAADGDDAVEQVRGFLKAEHTKDKNGPTAARVTIINVQDKKKYLLSAEPKIVTADEIRAFVKSFVDGTATGAPLR
jgi:hypothetical protein